jgi:hypothetical protein
MAPILAPLFGVHFLRGCFSLKNRSYRPPIGSQYKPFQKHVSSYQVKRSPGCFVWAAPTSLRDGPYLVMEEELSSTLTRGAGSNPARVLWREKTTTEKYSFSNIQTQRIITEYRNRCSSRPN